MSKIKYLVLALGALAFASLIAVSGPSKSVQAQTAEPTPSTLTLEKLCDEGVVGPFIISIDVVFDPVNEDDGGIDENTAFNQDIEIDCDDVLVFNADDTPGPTDPEVEDLDEYLEDFVIELCFISPADCPTITATFSEEIEGIASEFEGDCPDLEISDGTIEGLEDFATQFDDIGLLCVITNSVDLAAIPDLIIDKTCIGGPGDGDADFNVLVSTFVGDEVEFDSLDCDEVMVVADLEDGIYRIQEFVTGPDAGDFTTSIVCTTAAGLVETPGQLALVEIEADPEAEVADDVECTIINVFDEDGGVDPGAPGAPGGVIVPIDIDNTNTNTLNNNNTNDNNNVNTNTQQQENFQEQINKNNQVTTVNSSPSVVIDFGD